MSPKSLVAQAPFIARCAGLFSANLQRYADSGEPVDVLPLCYKMAMDAIGYTAFGIDLKSLAAAAATPLADQQGVDAVASIKLAGGKGGKGGAPAPADDEWWKVRGGATRQERAEGH